MPGKRDQDVQPPAGIITGEPVESTQIAATVELNTLEESTRQQIQSTYKNAVKDEINKHLHQMLKKLLATLKEYSDSQRGAVLIEAIQQNLNAEDKQLLELLLNNDKPLTYKENRKLFQALQATLDNLKENPTYAKERHLFNLALNALGSYKPLMRFNVPELVETINTVVVMKETRHYLKQKKKTFLQKIIEAIFPFFKKTDTEVIKQESLNLSTLQQEAAKFAADKVASRRDIGAEQAINQLQSQIKARQETKHVDLMPAQQQITQLSSVQSVPSKASTFIAGGYQLAQGVSEGILYQLGNIFYGTSVGSALAETLEPNRELTLKNLAEGFHEEFTQAAKKEAFITMLQFAAHLYAMQETIERFKADHPAISIDQAALGLKRLEEQDFKQFLTGLAKALGFGEESNLASAIEKLYYNQADEKSLMAAFERFMQNQQAGLNSACEIMMKEYEQLIKKSPQELKDSNHYLYLLSLNKELLDELRSKTRIKNAVYFALNETQLESELYSPDAEGLQANIKHKLKEKLIKNLPKQIKLMLNNAINLSKESQGYNAYINENLQRYFSEKLNESLVENSARTLPSSTKHTTTSQRKAQWREADKSDLKLEPPNKKDFLRIMQEEGFKVWNNFAVKLLSNVQKANQPEFNQVLRALAEQELNTLQEAQAHMDKIDRVRKQLSLWDSVLNDKGFLDENKIKSLSPQELKSLIDFVHAGSKKLSAQPQTLSLEQKNFIFMLNEALKDVKKAYYIPKMGYQLYDEVFKTEFDVNQKNKVVDFIKDNSLFKKVIGKVGGMIQERVNTALKHSCLQFEYYAQEMIQKDASNPPIFSMPVAAAPASRGYLATGYQMLASGYQLLSSGFQATKPIYNVVSQGVTAYLQNQILALPFDQTPDGLNDFLVNNTKEYMREQTFSTAFEIVARMHEIYELNKNLKELHEGEKQLDPFVEAGLKDEKTYYNFLNKLASSLGFSNIELLSKLYADVKVLDNKIQVLERECAARRGMLYNSADLPEYEQELNEAKREKQQLEENFKELNKRFARLPQNAQQEKMDPFVSLKVIIQEEYKNNSKQIAAKKLTASSTYVALVSSLNKMVSDVEKAQRITLAVELLSPNLDEKLRFDPKAQGLWVEIKKAAYQELQAKALAGAKAGTAFLLQDSIAHTKDFTSELLNKLHEKVSKKLTEAHFSAVTQASARKQNGLNFQYRAQSDHEDTKRSQSPQEPSGYPKNRNPRA